jgi:hypothetical protein
MRLHYMYVAAQGGSPADVPASTQTKKQSTLKRPPHQIDIHADGAAAQG